MNPRSARLLPDYGITKAMLAKFRPIQKKMENHIKHERLVPMSRMFEKIGGHITELADSSMPEDFREYLDENNYRWEISVGPEGSFFLRKAGYDTKDNTIKIRFNSKLPSMLAEYYYSLDREKLSDEDKVHLLRDLAKTDVSMRHEVTHLLRDARTGHLKKTMKKMEKDRMLQEKYRMRHDEFEFEIDAIINGLDQLKKRLGPARYDKLTPKRLEQLMVVTFPPYGSPLLSRWVKRLMREGLLTTGMKKEWRLKTGSLRGESLVLLKLAGELLDKLPENDHAHDF